MADALVMAVARSVKVGRATRRVAVAALVAAVGDDDAVRFWVGALEEAEACYAVGDASAVFDTWARQFWLDDADADEPKAAQAVRELFFDLLWRCGHFRRNFMAASPHHRTYILARSTE